MSIKIKAILLMGGSGLRFGSRQPKQFHRLSGKKIYLHTLEKFVASNRFDEIILVCHRDWIIEVREDLKKYSAHPIKVVEGGVTRQESSYLGLLACGENTQHVVIHDAVRPFITQEIISANIERSLKHSAVDTCIPSADTIVHSRTGDEIAAIPKRAEYLRGQTPQSFAYDLILKAHERGKSQQLIDVSDDCRLVIELGHPIHIVAGDERNIKITTELDLFIAEQLFRLNQIQQPRQSSRALKGLRIAITGGTGGVGRAIEQLLLKEGAVPLIISKSSLAYPADLTDFGKTAAVFDKIHEQHGPIDGLINCLGLFKLKDIASLSSQEIEELIAVNLTGLIFSCKSAKLKSGGHIINIASSAYSRGRKNYTVYSSAKAAVVNFTQGLAEERPDLYVNAIAPQRTNTSMRQRHFPEEDKNTLLPPENIATAIADLLQQEHITGSIITL